MTLDNPNILNDVLLSHTMTPYHQLSSPLTPVIKNMVSKYRRNKKHNFWNNWDFEFIYLF